MSKHPKKHLHPAPESQLGLFASPNTAAELYPKRIESPVKTETATITTLTGAAGFAGTKNRRQLELLRAFMARRRPLTRKQVDIAANTTNGPEVVRKLRARGLEIPNTPVSYRDAHGHIVRFSHYALTPIDRLKIRMWSALTGEF